MLAPKFCTCVALIPYEHPWEVIPNLCFYRNSDEIEKEEQVPAENVTTKEEFQGEWTAPAPEITATQPRGADWSERVQLPQCQSSSSLLKTKSAQLAAEDWSAAPTAQATECLRLYFHRRLRRKWK